jgi:hypothetical protein
MDIPMKDLNPERSEYSYVTGPDGEVIMADDPKAEAKPLLQGIKSPAKFRKTYSKANRKSLLSQAKVKPLAQSPEVQANLLPPDFHIQHVPRFMGPKAHNSFFSQDPSAMDKPVIQEKRC